ncbi:unnamed protein product, partial [Pylaiella littoralis]
MAKAVEDALLDITSNLETQRGHLAAIIKGLTKENELLRRERNSLAEQLKASNMGKTAAVAPAFPAACPAATSAA